MWACLWGATIQPTAPAGLWGPPQAPQPLPGQPLPTPHVVHTPLTPHPHHSLLCLQHQRENQVFFPPALGAPPSRHLGDLLQPVSPPKGFLLLLLQPETFSRIPFFEIVDAGRCGPFKVQRPPHFLIPPTSRALRSLLGASTAQTGP